MVLQTAGIKGEHVMLLVEDFHITTESILEVINSLLSAGEGQPARQSVCGRAKRSYHHCWSLFIED